MDILFLFLMVIGFMLIGVPIAVSLGLSSVLFLLMHSDASLASVAQTLFNAFAGHYTLLAIPFFLFWHQALCRLVVSPSGLFDLRLQWWVGSVAVWPWLRLLPV